MFDTWGLLFILGFVFAFPLIGFGIKLGKKLNGIQTFLIVVIATFVA
jgi:hypothetical protein